jgi:hypothetical protein
MHTSTSVLVIYIASRRSTDGLAPRSSPPFVGQLLDLTLPPKATPRPHDPSDVNSPRYDYGWIVPSVPLLEEIFPRADGWKKDELENYFRPKWYESPAAARAQEAYGPVAKSASLLPSPTPNANTKTIHLPSLRLRPRLELIDPHQDYFVLRIMSNDTEEHIAKVINDLQYFQDVREFFKGGLVEMRRHPMWFLSGLKEVPWSAKVGYGPREVNGFPKSDSYAMSQGPLPAELPLPRL